MPGEWTPNGKLYPPWGEPPFRRLSELETTLPKRCSRCLCFMTWCGVPEIHPLTGQAELGCRGHPEYPEHVYLFHHTLGATTRYDIPINDLRDGTIDIWGPIKAAIEAWHAARLSSPGTE